METLTDNMSVDQYRVLMISPFTMDLFIKKHTYVKGSVACRLLSAIWLQEVGILDGEKYTNRDRNVVKTAVKSLNVLINNQYTRDDQLKRLVASEMKVALGELLTTAYHLNRWDFRTIR